jgi:amidase
MSWELVAKQSQANVLRSIPERWRLDAGKYISLKDVTEVPRTCGLLSEEQLEITELGATEIALRLESRQLTAVQVLEAFAGRAAIAHQLVRLCSQVMTPTDLQ